MARFTIAITDVSCTRDLWWETHYRVENTSTDTISVSTSFQTSNGDGFQGPTFTLAPGQSDERSSIHNQGVVGGTIQAIGNDGQDTVTSNAATLPDCLLTRACDCETATPGITCRAEEVDRALYHLVHAERETDLPCFKIRKLTSGRFVVSACSTSQTVLDRIFQ